MDSLPRGPNYSELCKLWLERARTLPLSLVLNGSLKLEQSVQDLLAQYGPQLIALTLYVSCSGLESPQVIWEREPGSLYSLKTLSIEPTDEDAYYGDMREWLELLRDSPELSLCALRNVFYHQQGIGGGPLDSLTLTSLEILRLGGRHANRAMNLLHNRGSSSAVILRYLTLPALKALTVSELDIADEEFFSFLHRSSPTLELFEMTLPHHHPWRDPLVSRCLGLMPALTALHLFARPEDGATINPFLSFVEVLSTSPEVLPNLREIVFRTDGQITVHYRELLRMLKFRVRSCPTPLERFTLRFEDLFTWEYMLDMPTNEVKAALRQMVGDGLTICIGPDEKFLSL
ncbi:hypothetical protein R3P38DRAFT_3058447 [Favolaschia claudopus]|uniref:Uncharacterized protein n=1 Tax=Favolaschia claudopus TaxID=2862362 RepID=A0AAW0A380_9AGAR